MSSYKIVYSGNMGSLDFEQSSGTAGVAQPAGPQQHPQLEQIKNLEEKVKNLLAQGWSCIGGVVLCSDDKGLIIRMYQTMVKVPI
jgi:hypothetical protein